MRWGNTITSRILREQRGLSLLEILVAVGVLAVIGTAFLSALTTSSKSVGLYEVRVNAMNLAQSQMEK
jgi:prepilin-type N-terminal cleavage/methylation domain-containing protein